MNAQRGWRRLWFLLFFMTTPFLLLSCSQEEDLSLAISTQKLEPTSQATHVGQETNTPRVTFTPFSILYSTSPPTPSPRLTSTPVPTPKSTLPGSPTRLQPSPSPTMTATALPSLTPTATALPLIIENEDYRMLLIPGDFFIMGVDVDVLADECDQFGWQCTPDLLLSAQPQHPVWVGNFYIDATEITNVAYAAFLSAIADHQTGCNGVSCLNLATSRIIQDASGDYRPEPEYYDHPVHSVTWFGANAYCNWRGARLPTEAEWEMAASWAADSNTKYLYPWGNRFAGEDVNFCDQTCTQAQSSGYYNDGYAETAPVGSFRKGRSPAGVYDMGGNVWEWVADWFSPRYYSQSPLENPAGPAGGVARVLRGGSWFDTGNFMTTVFRTGLAPYESNDSIGFRCAWSPN